MKTLFFICLIALSCTMSIEKSQMSALQQYSFGSLFAEIQAKIKAGGPLDNIFTLLDDLEAQVRTEQREHKAMLDTNQGLCDEEQTFRRNEVTEGSAALKAATNHHMLCENSEMLAETDLATTRQNLADDKAALQAATMIREDQAALFVQRVRDHAGAQSALDGALSLLDELSAQDVTLLEFSHQSSVLLKTGVKIGLTSAYVPIVAMFAQMASSDVNMFMEDSSVARIKAMLEQLKENIGESARAYAQEEEAQQQSFAILKSSLESSINTLETNQENLIDHIDEMKQCVLEEQLVMSDAQSKVDRNQGLLDASTNMCDAFLAEYTSATEARDEEIELIDTVRAMVRQKLSGLTATSVGRRDDGFEQYEDENYAAGEVWESAQL